MIPPVLKRFLQQHVEGLFGRASTWQQHRLARKNRPTIDEALGTLRNRWEAVDGDGDDPVFIFSAGWRSGSTLLQRLVLSGNEALVWGEPYPYCDYIRTMAESLRAFTDTMPADQFILPEPGRPRDVDPGSWTACLYPHPRHILRAHRSFFQTLYRDPALTRGYARWGLKEVVLSSREAAYLAWLFPEARFVFLYRNPYDAFRSYRSFGDWYYRWPDDPVFTAHRFGRVWRTLLESFLEEHRSFDAVLLSYEQLTSDPAETLERLSAHLKTTVAPEIMAGVVTGRPEAGLPPIPTVELMQLRRAVEPLASRLGYEPAP